MQEWIEPLPSAAELPEPPKTHRLLQKPCAYLPFADPFNPSFRHALGPFSSKPGGNSKHGLQRVVLDIFTALCCAHLVESKKCCSRPSKRQLSTRLHWPQSCCQCAAAGAPEALKLHVSSTKVAPAGLPLYTTSSHYSDLLSPDADRESGSLPCSLSWSSSLSLSSLSSSAPTRCPRTSSPRATFLYTVRRSRSLKDSTTPSSISCFRASSARVWTFGATSFPSAHCGQTHLARAQSSQSVLYAAFTVRFSHALHFRGCVSGLYFRYFRRHSILSAQRSQRPPVFTVACILRVFFEFLLWRKAVSFWCACGRERRADAEVSMVSQVILEDGRYWGNNPSLK
jgi:hypothetical protein